MAATVLLSSVPSRAFSSSSSVEAPALNPKKAEVLKILYGIGYTDEDLEYFADFDYENFAEMVRADGPDALVRFFRSLGIQPTRERVIDKIHSCKATRALWKKACATPHPVTGFTGEWCIEFNPRTNTGFAAECDHLLRTLRLSPASSDEEAFIYIIFELTNATKGLLHYAHKQKGMARSISCNAYAKGFEKSEDEGCTEHHEVVQAGISEGVVKESMDIFRARVSIPFEKRWKEGLKDTLHVEYFRKEYREMNCPDPGSDRAKVHEIMKEAGLWQSTIDSFEERHFVRFEEILRESGEKGAREYFTEERDLFNRLCNIELEDLARPL